MTTTEDTLIDTEIRDEWWNVGEAVMREMCEEDDQRTTFYNFTNYILFSVFLSRRLYKL